MNREKAKNKYKWNVDKLYKTKREFLEDLELLSINMRAQTLFKGSLKNYQDFCDFDELSEQGNVISSRIEQFFKILDVEPHHKIALDFQAIYDKEMEKFDGQFSWIEDEIKGIGEKQIYEWLETKESWKPYRRTYKKFFKNLKYLLPEKDRVLLDKVSKSSGLIYEMYDSLKNKDNETPILNYKNKEYKLTQSKYVDILEKSDPFLDQELRALAVRKYHQKDFENKYGFAKIYESIIKEETETLKLIGMKDFQENFFGEENISVESFKALVKFASENSSLYHKYFTLVKNYWGFKEKYFSSDASLIFYPDAFQKISLKQGVEHIKKALQPLGEEYVENLKDALLENKIDYFESPYKSSGAFTTFSYEFGSLISMNWNDNFSSMLTLSHELGHSVHNKFSKDQQQKPLNYFNNIIAEVSSTLNEQIVIDYLLINNISKEMKANILKERIEFIINNFYHGIQESYFEFECFKVIDKDENLTLEKIVSLNKKTDTEIFGKSPFDKYDDNLKNISWSLSSHIFEQPFYLYKYALSLVMSFQLFQDFKNGDSEKVVSFLKDGGSLEPQDLFQKYGVDICNPRSYEPLIKYLNELILELEKCLIN
ncbi:M3 family metallopeptidase [Spiroplasma alleghenense]|uniref:Oligoendopeptidase F n=1 Tax=Spiroplasma alleghenense TaxID=216931 RepID=A0A345Z3E9_9MOLU|nr:M3 family metallopeptidase [Spiroplasma alleghenense]AXK51128.1 oligoendopeptidase F [Spiroplasma alleghenense]